MKLTLNDCLCFNKLSVGITVHVSVNIAVTHMGTDTLMPASQHSVSVPHVLLFHSFCFIFRPSGVL